MDLVYGLDFGTSNTSLAVSGRDGPPRLLPLDPHAEQPEVLPTQVYFGRDEKGSPYVTHGTLAWKDLLRAGVRGDGRFLFELKAVLGAPVRSTKIQGRHYEVADLVAQVIRYAKTSADRAVGADVRRVVCGRPVRFSDDPEVDARAQETLARALARAGFDEHHFELEPVAADAVSGGTEGVTLTVDIGGGTLDVSVVARRRGEAPRVLGVSGRAQAGRNVDRRLIDERLLGPFGREVQWDSSASGKVPEWIFQKIGSWSEFHLLAEDSSFRRALARAEVDSRRHPQVLSLGRYFLERHGYSFVKEVEARKIELSEVPAARVRFVGAGIIVLEEVRREHLGPVLAPLLEALDACIDEALAQARLPAAEVTAVERIGGSSRIPAVGERLAKMFGAEKVRGTGSLTAVALGLAELARRRWLA